MKMTFALLLAAGVLLLAAPARAGDQDNNGTGAPKADELVTPQQETQPNVPVVPVQSDQLPRRLRWKRMQVSYLRAHVCHPAVYWANATESPKFNDAAVRNCLCQVGVWLYEAANYGAQVALTPIEWLFRPPWTTECSGA